jgi:hypothetical protein
VDSPETEEISDQSGPVQPLTGLYIYISVIYLYTAIACICQKNCKRLLH